MYGRHTNNDIQFDQRRHKKGLELYLKMTVEVLPSLSQNRRTSGDIDIMDRTKDQISLVGCVRRTYLLTPVFTGKCSFIQSYSQGIVV